MNKKRVCLVFLILFLHKGFSQQTEKLESSKEIEYGKIRLKTPQSIQSKYQYDPILDRFIYSKKIGEFDISTPKIITKEQYYELVKKERIKSYFKKKLDAVFGKKKGALENQKDINPILYVNSGVFESIFGGKEVFLDFSGAFAMDIGMNYQKNENPLLSSDLKENYGFDLGQNINFSLKGKIGERLTIEANYDTESTFEFQNLIKAQYKPQEDDIIKKIEVGNVSFPLNSSLIRGSQNLFGASTELQFGKTYVKGVWAEQRSQSKNITVQNGGVFKEFKFTSLDYEENKHFFLAQYFKDNYDETLENYPFINSQIQITRIEVWTTNRARTAERVRNIVAIQDLGEAKIQNTKIANGGPAGFFNPISSGDLPNNYANDFNPLTIGTESVLTESIREIPTVHNGFGVLQPIVNQGHDYDVLENAIKLEEGKEFHLNKQLGFISLNRTLNNNEVLAVAFQYTINGEIYQVGEFSNGSVSSTSIDVMTSQVSNNTLVLKLLKSSILNVEDPVWDLMMKNIYNFDGFKISKEKFNLNIFYANPSPINYISSVDPTTWNEELDKKTLINIFHLDNLNAYGDPQSGGDGVFDFVEGITINSDLGYVMFTKREPFGSYLHEILGGGNYQNVQSYNLNQKKYVFQDLYFNTKAKVIEEAEKNRYLIKGSFKSDQADGISLGAFNIPQGSVKITAGGKTLQEGMDYLVNYQTGRVKMLDPSIEASNTPINISLENNAVFGQQEKNLTGINVEHTLSKDLLLGFTWLNLSEKPFTQKVSFGREVVDNNVFGLNGKFYKELPFLTRWLNKYPTIKTDTPSSLSVSSEIAYLSPGAPEVTNLGGQTTTYVDDFEGNQALISLKSPNTWSLSSTPVNYAGTSTDVLSYGERRVKLAWYSIDPLFYRTSRPKEINADDVSTNQTRQILINELYSEQDIARGSNNTIQTLDLAYYPEKKGPYNNNPNYEGLTEDQKWAGIIRSIVTTNFEQSNIEYIQFWVLDPYYNAGPIYEDEGGEMVINLGLISEDVLKDGRKQFENGLPGNSNENFVVRTIWGNVPSTQSINYLFDVDTENRNRQDLGLDGLDDNSEKEIYRNNLGEDPANDNYKYYLDRRGNILERYIDFNGTQGNSPVEVSQNSRGSRLTPDVEDADLNQTMNTINSYFEYRIKIKPDAKVTDKYITDIKETTVILENGNTIRPRWIQYKIPIKTPDNIEGGITDFRSITHMRVYLTEFEKDVVLRFASLDLGRRDWRIYNRSLESNLDDPIDDGTTLESGTVNILENETKTPIPYTLPPGIEREEIFTNNAQLRQNEQSLLVKTCDLKSRDLRAVFKNVEFDFRQYKYLKMYVHAEQIETNTLNSGDLVAFIRIGTDFTDNYYQIEKPLEVTPHGALSTEQIWPSTNSFDIPLSVLKQLKSIGIANRSLENVTFYDEALNPVNEFSQTQIGQHKYAIKGNPSLGSIKSIMIGLKNNTNNDLCGEVWFNELRLSELENTGGWATIGNVELNIAGFANISASGKLSSIGFGTVDQKPNERSLDNERLFNLSSTFKLGKLFPEKWNIKIPVAYQYSKKIVTPKYDKLYEDIELDHRINNAKTDEEKEEIIEQSENYTEAYGINFIGVKKTKSESKKKNYLFDIENFSFDFSYNEERRRNFEIEKHKTQNVNSGFTYQYNFPKLEITPFQKGEFFSKNYMKWLKAFNLNLLPASFSTNSRLFRTHEQQRLRQVNSYDLDPLTQRESSLNIQKNYLFDWQYFLSYNISKSLQLNITASSNRIIKNYFRKNLDGTDFIDSNGYKTLDTELGVFDKFWDIGDANSFNQNIQLKYQLPFSKLPLLNIIRSNYRYQGSFNWQRGSDLLYNVSGQYINSIQNSGKHSINNVINFQKLYENIGLNVTQTNNRMSFGKKLLNSTKTFVSMVKRVNVRYDVNTGVVLPGYTNDIAFLGSTSPSLLYVLGYDDDIRNISAKNGWLTDFDKYNELYKRIITHNLRFQAIAQPLNGLNIELNALRRYSETEEESFNIESQNGITNYNKLFGNTTGSYTISTILLGSSFESMTKETTRTVTELKNNRIIIANRLAEKKNIDLTDENNLDTEMFPKGYSKNSQDVILPALLAAYKGESAHTIDLEPFPLLPFPNWTLTYTGLMNINEIKEKFNRLSISHNYSSTYSINNFRSNLNHDTENPEKKNNIGDYEPKVLFNNITLVEQFFPLIKLDFELQNNLSILTEMRKTRTISLNFTSSLLTDTKSEEYVVGVGYRFQNVGLRTRLGQSLNRYKGDINLKLDFNWKENLSVIRNIEINNNQIAAGQENMNLRITANYVMSRDLSVIFFYDHAFSDYKISTAFPLTTIRTGFTFRFNFGN